MEIRVWLGLALVFLLPGFAIAAALFPGNSIGWAQRILFGVGLSVAVTILAGLGLQLSGVGLQPIAWVTLLGGITLGAAAVALVRNWGRLASRVATPRPAASLRDVGLFVLAASVLISSLALARVPAPPQGAQGYSSLYLVPAHNGNPNDIRLGISSGEFAATHYRVEVLWNKTVVHEWPEITLKPGETWEVTLELPGGQNATGKVEAALYRLTAPTVVYRHVSLLAGPGTGQD